MLNNIVPMLVFSPRFSDLFGLRLDPSKVSKMGSLMFVLSYNAFIKVADKIPFHRGTPVAI